MVFLQKGQIGKRAYHIAIHFYISIYLLSIIKIGFHATPNKLACGVLVLKKSLLMGWRNLSCIKQSGPKINSENQWKD